MKFDYVTITIKNVDDESAGVKVDFFPPFPDDEESVEEQPCLTLLDQMLESISDDDSSEQWLQ